MADSAFEVVVIGAGLAGLTCAQRLQQMGYQVVVVEKSRGVGGRLATRRLHGTFADHGTCYLSPKNHLFQQLVNHLVELNVVQPWLEEVYEWRADGELHRPPAADRTPRYASQQGMTAIAKFLARGLDIRLNQRTIGLELTGNRRWQVTSEETTPDSTARTDLWAEAVVCTVPAPQAITLLQSLPESVLAPDFIRRLKSVQFFPCLSAIAGYPPNCHQDWLNRYPEVRAIKIADDSDLAWIGLDSSKRASSPQPVFVLQSTAAFAEKHLEVTDLQPAAGKLLKQAAKRFAPWLETPDWLQIHRWRYAFAPGSSAETETHWVSNAPIPLACAGDWCSGIRAENAFLSGLEVAETINYQLRNLPSDRQLLWETR
jgi:renalase